MVSPLQASDLRASQHEISALLRIKSNLLARKMDLAFDRLEQLELEQRYSDNQPRGRDGRWVDTGAGGARGLLRKIPKIGAAAVAAYELYERLSKFNTDKEQAVAEFVSRDYRPEEPERLKPRQVAMLDRDKVDAACPRLAEVEMRTQEAMDRVKRERPELSGAQLGTAVHYDLSQQIKALNDPNFVAERSFIKSTNARYGLKDSTRIDVFERVGNGTVCVYDIKTGDARLRDFRSFEIATSVLTRFPDTNRIIVTETKPRR
jgi:hypothetical protein